jgi:hypothetical protein
MFTSTDMKDQNLLCELYLHDFILQDNVSLEPQPLCWGCTVVSILISHPWLGSMEKDMDFHARIEAEESLKVREEYPLPHVMKDDLQRLRSDPGDTVTIRHHQRYAITEYLEVSRAYSIHALLVSHDIWETLPTYLRNKNPMGYLYFGLALNRASFYANSLLRYKTRWIGLQFHFPIIWFPRRFYRAPVTWNEEEERTQWIQMDMTLGYYNTGEFGHPTFDWGKYMQGLQRRISWGCIGTCNQTSWGEMMDLHFDTFFLLL